MMDSIVFTKMNGCGNDFILVDQELQSLTKEPDAFIKMLCERKHGVGADGLITVTSATNADVKMRIFNADGSEAEMCGNGARCAALFAFEKGMAGTAMTIETLAGVLEANILDDHMVKVRMSDPVDYTSVLLDMKNRESFEHVLSESLEVFSINTGVPHVVVVVDDIEAVDVQNQGAKIRYDEHFAPQGTNVNFVQVQGENALAIRTYERGVEGETLACGTGSTAAAIVAGLNGQCSSPVTVLTRSGEELKIYFNCKEDNLVDQVFMEGSALIVYEGRITDV